MVKDEEKSTGAEPWHRHGSNLIFLCVSLSSQKNTCTQAMNCLTILVEFRTILSILPRSPMTNDEATSLLAKFKINLILVHFLNDN